MRRSCEEYREVRKLVDGTAVARGPAQGVFYWLGFFAMGFVFAAGALMVAGFLTGFMGAWFWVWVRFGRMIYHTLLP